MMMMMTTTTTTTTTMMMMMMMMIKIVKRSTGYLTFYALMLRTISVCVKAANACLETGTANYEAENADTAAKCKLVTLLLCTLLFLTFCSEYGTPHPPPHVLL